MKGINVGHMKNNNIQFSQRNRYFLLLINDMISSYVLVELVSQVSDVAHGPLVLYEIARKYKIY